MAGQIFTLPIPANLSPTATKCISFQVPDDPDWLAMFWGMLRYLAVWTTYDRDDDHDAASVADVWKEVLATARGSDCVSGILFDHTDCTLSVSLDGGTTWTEIFNAEACILRDLNSGELQGGGGTGPGPIFTGQCNTYHAQMSPATGYALPTVVSAGDTITITNAGGAASDGWPFQFWWCPDGQEYAFGQCFGGTTSPKSGDPDGGHPHMRLLALIDGTYYDAFNTVITVPGGVSNAAVEFLVNDDPAKAANGLGAITFDVEVCTGTCTTWDFTAVKGPWQGIDHPSPDPEDGSTTSYVASTGWQGDNYSPPGGSNQSVVDIKQVFPSTQHVNTIRVVWSGPTNSTFGSDLLIMSAGATIASFAYAASGDHTFTIAGDLQDIEIKLGRGNGTTLDAVCLLTLAELCV